ncbi:MAG: RpiB/LacA/LacB family sugar-phosphate isomerase [Candidatus Dojkabacteria bacterium]|nr:RpiB/LacA/LacB family sugar-phosphate isomerase [Candidatus Dojkabacteria bacterium]MDQ7020297.1 RpiB/LacA/LacB family sugar-phosphate isomerase [Candidatus Dojkabacteria bacterium]
MTIYIASDHGGFSLKNELVEAIEQNIVDLGPYELDTKDDYPDFAKLVAEKVMNESDALGILICRSGNGMVMTANKFKGCYAALCFTSHHSEMARRDDNANILCLDADYEGEDPLKIVNSFLNTEFTGMDSRHGRRFNKIKEIEGINFRD